MAMIRVNGKQQDNIAALDRGLAYGDGLFETIAVIHGQPRRWAAHMQRLEAGCAQLAIAFPGRDVLAQELAALEAKEKYVLKIIVTRGVGERGYIFNGDETANIVVIQSDWPSFDGNPAQDGIKMRVCQLRLADQPALAGIKHLNRLEQVMARAEWDDKTITEGLMLDQNTNVIEGTMSNVFMVRRGQLFTPQLDRCGVRGVQRNYLIDLTRSLDLTVNEINIPLSEMQNAEELFICNSIIGLWPVIQLDDDKFSIGDVIRKLQHALMPVENET